MFADRNLLQRALKALDEAQRDGRNGCLTPRLDEAGSDLRVLSTPKGPKAIPYGVHGTDFLEVHLVSGALRCGACLGALDATVSTDAT